MKKQLILIASLFAPFAAFAQEAATAAHTAGGGEALMAIGAGVAIGIAALGGALGQGKIGSSAMDGIARNPQARQEMFVPMIIGLALIESLVIYALVIAFQLIGKIG